MDPADDAWFAQTPPPREPSAAELAIEEVAADVFRMPLPVPFEVGPVNAYLIRRAEPVLIDSGPKTDAAWGALERHLAALGARASDLRHAFSTHAHVDHHGNLGRIAAAAPAAALYAHEVDATTIFDHDASMLARVQGIERLARSWGYPEAALPAVRKGYLSFRKLADTVDRARLTPVRGERQDLALGAVRLRALHCPGHTEGLICLHLDEGEGLLFSNDHVLERITPNPTVYLEPFRGRRSGLGHYIESLERLRDLRAGRVLPGHGASFGGLRARIDEIVAHHDRRKARIAEILADGRRRTILELARELWPKLPEAEHYLACREAQGHLDLLIADRTAIEEEDPGGVRRFLTCA